MKKLTSILYFIAILIPVAACALTFQWDAPVDESNIVGYTLYIENKTTNEKPDTISFLKTDITNHSYAVSIHNPIFVQGNNYNFWMTAYNNIGESARSNIVNWTADIPKYVPPATTVELMEFNVPNPISVFQIKFVTE